MFPLYLFLDLKKVINKNDHHFCPVANKVNFRPASTNLLVIFANECAYKYRTPPPPTNCQHAARSAVKLCKLQLKPQQRNVGK